MTVPCWYRCKECGLKFSSDKYKEDGTLSVVQCPTTLCRTTDVEYLGRLGELFLVKDDEKK